MRTALKFGFAIVAVLALSTAAAQAQARPGMGSTQPSFSHGGGVSFGHGAPVQSSVAQRSNFQPSFAGGPSPMSHVSLRINSPGFVDGFRRYRFVRNSFSGGWWPYWAPWDYYDSYQPEAMAAPQAPATVIQPAKQEPVPDAVLLELQGNQWVKVDRSAPVSAVAGATAPSQPEQATAKELPPAILVYRDGHREELSSYSIIGTTIYTKADYWSSGAWNRKINIADLDVPATVKQNRERGVRFDLPSGPNEVILRP